MGMFKNVKDAKANFGANYEREGNYIMFVRRVKLDKNRNDEWFVAVEKVAIECINPGAEPKPHRVGEQCSHLLCNYGKGKDSFLPNYKALIMNVFDVPEDEVDEDACDLVTSDDQPMAGIFLEMQNKNVVTKEGKDFTRIKYIRAIPLSEIAERVDMEVLKKCLTRDEVAYYEAKLTEELNT